MANLAWYQVNRPEGVRRVLQENYHNYGVGSLSRNILVPVLGEGLINRNHPVRARDVRGVPRGG